MSARSIGSHPGAGVFRSTLVIIIILLSILYFFHSTRDLGRRVETVAADRVVTEMRQALAMMLYDYAIQGRLNELERFDRENPFVPLSIYRDLPTNYHGVVSDAGGIAESGWYFDRAERVAVYRHRDPDRPDRKLSLVFVFEDLDGDRRYGSGEVGYLSIEKA